MNPVKIKTLKLGNALKVGRTEIVFATCENYDISLFEDNRVTIVEKKSGAKGRTSLFNVVGWIEEEEAPLPSENEDVHIHSEPSMIEDSEKEPDIEPQPEPLKSTARRGIKKKTTNKS